MLNLAKKLEVLANIAIILVAILITVVLVKSYILPSSTNTVAENEVRAGTHVPLPGVDWSASSQTLLLALSQNCHFCSESAPFYQRLAHERAQRGSLRLIAVLPQPVVDGQKYLSDLGLSVDDVRQVPLSSLGVVGTPTLILVNKVGVATEVWRGKLPGDAESQVLAKLKEGLP